MLLNRLLGESIEFTFKNKCCLNKEKRANATTRQALCYLVCYINVYIAAFCVMHNLQRQKSWQERPVEMLTFISVAGSNKEELSAGGCRFGCVLSNLQDGNLHRSLEADLPKEKVEKLPEPSLYS